MSQTEIKVLEKGLGFSPTPSFINEAGLRWDFNEFSRRMRCKWYFRNKTQSSKEIPTFHSKSTWNPPKGSPALELFSNKTEQNLFSVLLGKAEQFNLTREEYLTMRNLQEDRSVIIKLADRGSAVVIWDRNDYLKEAKKQLSDKSTYLETKVIEKDLVDLVEQSNEMFENLQRKSVIQEKEKNYFKFNFKKATNLGKLYALKYIRAEVMFLVVLSFQVVEHRLKRFQNSLTININPS